MTEPSTTRLKTIRLRIPDAQSVSAMGSFNNWSAAASPLRAVGEGLWELKVPTTANVQDMHFFVWRRGEMFGYVFGQGAVQSVPVSEKVAVG